MRTIERTARFRRDYRRVAAGPRAAAALKALREVVDSLVRDEPLSARRRDHGLSGEWDDHRDCHVQPDLVLIYRQPDDNTLQLVRLGSHSELKLD